jgi:hypothetical protein
VESLSFVDVYRHFGIMSLHLYKITRRHDHTIPYGNEYRTIFSTARTCGRVFLMSTVTITMELNVIDSGPMTTSSPLGCTGSRSSVGCSSWRGTIGLCVNGMPTSNFHGNFLNSFYFVQNYKRTNFISTTFVFNTGFEVLT